jgi:hypothetical protein
MFHHLCRWFAAWLSALHCIVERHPGIIAVNLRQTPDYQKTQ